ncbi:MAG: tRNA lysidine(34) synthetase TilS [Alphaproteobacteria bacterium]|nr:tRNA lysidine(34) synthetase TilS [Alphaproteobacteria bacterium]
MQIASRQLTAAGFLARLARLVRHISRTPQIQSAPSSSANKKTSKKTSEKTDYHFALAVSGGADSLSMMLLAAKAAQQKQTQKSGRQNFNCQFSVLTVDHRLRKQATQEARYVADLAKQMALPHHLLTWRGAKPQSDIQAAARTMRYQLMSDWCLKHKADGLVLAHHLDDQAETVLLRLMRGAGVDGLAAMQAVRYQNGVALLRPFLDVPRAVLRKTIHASPIEPIDDPSNQNRQFARVQMRQLMPALADIGITAARLAQTAQNMQTSRQALDLATQAAARALIRIDEFGILSLARAGFADLHEEIALRLLRTLLRQPESYPPRAEKLHRVWQDMISKKTGRRTLNGYLLHLRRDHIMISRELAAIEKEQGACLQLALGKTLIWDARYKVTFHKQSAHKQAAHKQAGHKQAGHKQAGHKQSAHKQARQSLTIRALRADGLQQLRDRKIALPKQLPSAALVSLVSLWRGQKILAVPAILAHKGVEVAILPHFVYNIAAERQNKA